jgi:hypothetical protein
MRAQETVLLILNKNGTTRHTFNIRNIILKAKLTMDSVWDEVVNACKEGDKVAVDFLTQQIAKTKEAKQCIDQCLTLKVGEIEWEENEIDLKDMLSKSPSNLKNLLNFSDRSGWTLLHFSCHCGCTLTIKLLLGLGASPLKRNLAGLLPSDLCQENGSNKDILEAWILWKNRLLIAHQKAKNIPPCLNKTRRFNPLEVSYSHHVNHLTTTDNSKNNGEVKQDTEAVTTSSTTTNNNNNNNKNTTTAPNVDCEDSLFAAKDNDASDKLSVAIKNRHSHNRLLRKFIHKDDAIVQGLCLARAKTLSGKTDMGDITKKKKSDEEELDGEGAEENENFEAFIGTIEKKSNNTVKNLKEATLERGQIINQIKQLKFEVISYIT